MPSPGPEPARRFIFIPLAGGIWPFRSAAANPDAEPVDPCSSGANREGPSAGCGRGGKGKGERCGKMWEEREMREPQSRRVTPSGKCCSGGGHAGIRRGGSNDLGAFGDIHSSTHAARYMHSSIHTCIPYRSGTGSVEHTALIWDGHAYRTATVDGASRPNEDDHGD